MRIRAVVSRSSEAPVAEQASLSQKTPPLRGAGSELGSMPFRAARSIGALIAVVGAVNRDGRREVLGMTISPSGPSFYASSSAGVSSDGRQLRPG